MRATEKLALAGASVIVLLQLIRPGIPSRSAISEIQAPEQVRQILDKDCYSCHSDRRRLAWFDEIEPAYWLVRHDILSAREHLNFSTIGSKPASAQKAALYEAVNMIQLSTMPLPQFVALHPGAKVTVEELTILKTYLAPWSEAPEQRSHSAGEKATPRTNLATVPDEFNGLTFEKDFKSWKPISFTDRGDNNTFRFILGNDIALKAARSGNISPWPEGTRFAKIAWQQETGSDGRIYPGKFVQVEFMLKEARVYKQTAGWGWGRWRGLDLKPYGKDARFTNECTTCHLPLRGADDVYTLPISAARASQAEVVNNRTANLPSSLPYPPLAWSAITMYVDPGAHTMATLFGNQTAMRAITSRGPASGQVLSYPTGAVLALVTWAQRDDPHWFGGRIPDTPRSIEFVEVNSQAGASSYHLYQANGMTEHQVPRDIAAQSAEFILKLTPATLP